MWGQNHARSWSLLGSSAFLLAGLSFGPLTPAQAAIIEDTGSGETPGAYPEIVTENTTSFPNDLFTGTPVGTNASAKPINAGTHVTFNFEQFTLVDGPGTEINVYEQWMGGGAEPDQLVVEASQDGNTFHRLSGLEDNDFEWSSVDLKGDDNHGDEGKRYSWDLGSGGLESAQYVRLSGTSSASHGMEVDAIGAAVPEPASAMLLGIGAGAIGLNLRRRSER